MAKEDEEERSATWMVWTDGSSNQWARGALVLLRSPKRDTFEYAIHLQFPTTNNETKYKADLSSLNMAKVAGAMSVVIYYNSQVVVRHINSDYKSKGEQMKEYLSMIKRKESERLSAMFV